MTDAYGRIHAETVLKQAVRADGIRPDGSFGQHSGILYNGNYGMCTYFCHASCWRSSSQAPYCEVFYPLTLRFLTSFISLNDVLRVEVIAAGTGVAADAATQGIIAKAFDGDRWMIYDNTITGKTHWDFSVLGRFIMFPVIDGQWVFRVSFHACPPILS
jgi:hypothetical protein